MGLTRERLVSAFSEVVYSYYKVASAHRLQIIQVATLSETRTTMADAQV